MKTVDIGETSGRQVRIGPEQPLAWIAGPCVIEDRQTMATAADHLARISEKLGVPLIFKSSFEKDNRTSEEAYSPGS